jgi:ATP-dependent Clp protease ATP-binding subunit ClpA
MPDSNTGLLTSSLLLLMCCGCVQVTEQDIANIVAQWTGIPIEKVSADETERLIKMEEVLHGRVIGQVRYNITSAVT